MGVEELQRVKDEVALNTMQAYFDVVYYTESVRLAREQLETSTGNLAKSRKLLELGLKSAADVAEQEAQCASDDYLLTQQENNLELARITLAETMNYPPDRPWDRDGSRHRNPGRHGALLRCGRLCPRQQSQGPQRRL